MCFFKIFFFFFFFFFFFRDRVSLFSPGCPGTHSADQVGLKLRDLPVSASPLLGLKAFATTLAGSVYLKVALLFSCAFINHRLGNVCVVFVCFEMRSHLLSQADWELTV